MMVNKLVIMILVSISMFQINTDISTDVIQPSEISVTTELNGSNNNINTELSIKEYIKIECAKRNLDYRIIYSVIEQESKWNEDAIGDNGDSLGLMQIQSRWHKNRMDNLGVSNLLDPYQNVLVGIDIIDELISKYGLYGGLAAYNTGSPSGYSQNSENVISNMSNY